MKKLKIKHLKLIPVIGIGYWKDVYKKEELGIGGVTHHVIILFVLITFGYLVLDENELKQKK